jgi:enamine deaminase RidA (YjgF/YER057c/UK114 family)
MTRNSADPIRRINPPELGAPPGYSQVVDISARRIVFIAGQTALDRDGELRHVYRQGSCFDIS